MCMRKRSVKDPTLVGIFSDVDNTLFEKKMQELYRNNEAMSKKTQHDTEIQV